MKKRRTREEAEVIRIGYQKDSFSKLQRRLDLMSEMLFMYSEKIKRMQPVGHGSLTPHLQVCSQRGCLGCLHVRWKRWFDPSKEQRKRNRMYGRKVREVDVASSFGSKDVKNIMNVLPRGDEFIELRETISAFESLRKQRESLVSHLKKALQCSAHLEF